MKSGGRGCGCEGTKRGPFGGSDGGGEGSGGCCAMIVLPFDK